MEGIVKIQRLSASNFKFYSPQGKVVLVDAWLTGDPFWPKSEKTSEKLREIDVLAITHAHFDHAAGIDEIARQNEKVSIIAQYEFAFSLIGRGIKNVVPTSYGGTVDVLGIKFSAVPAFHTSSIMDAEGNSHIVGTPMGYVIEFEDGRKVYASGDTGLTADMKFVVGDYYKPDISLLPATGGPNMEPEQAAYAAHATGCSIAIPFHDFPRNVSDAADPQGYAEFVKGDPFSALDSYKRIERFMETLRTKYPHIKGVYIPIGGTADI
jgi:L-ascorbate metabolism protein UlaG (beta-lactamase superfamily)